MSIPIAKSDAAPAGPPPRTNGTPSGYRNIRVLVAYAGLSMCSLNEFILKVLNQATPIDPSTGLPVPAHHQETALGHRPGQDRQGGSGDASGLGVTFSPKPPVRSPLGPSTDPRSFGTIGTLDPADLPPGQKGDGARPGGGASD